MSVYVLAILAALLFGTGSVVQQRAAAQAPPEDNLSFRLLFWLVRQRLWLIGVGFSVVGNLLSANALARGSVALVEPLFVVRLLFALPLAAAWSKHSVPRRDWTGAILTAVGLAMFVIAGNPHQGEVGNTPVGSWIIAGGTIVGLATIMMLAAKRMDAVRQAVLLAGGAGLLFGLQAALTHSAMQIFRNEGIPQLLQSWQTYAVLVTALYGTLLVQSAYEVAPLPASFPALVTAEPIVGIAVGVGVLGGSIRLAPFPFAVEVVGIGVMIAGIIVLASSPLVTGQLHRLERRQEEGQAYRTEEQLERDLERLHTDLDAFDRHLQAGPGVAEKDRAQIQHDLDRIDEHVDRLCELQDDIARHRSAEAEHMAARPQAEQEHYFRGHDAELDARERAIDERAHRLQEHADALRARARELTGEYATERPG